LRSLFNTQYTHKQWHIVIQTDSNFNASVKHQLPVCAFFVKQNGSVSLESYAKL